MTMEQGHFEDLLQFDSDEELIFQSIHSMAEGKKDSKKNEFIGQEIRRRAEGHGMNAVDLGEKYWKWIKYKRAA